jgi:signal transduction histidine kinase
MRMTISGKVLLGSLVITSILVAFAVWLSGALDELDHSAASAEDSRAQVMNALEFTRVTNQLRINRTAQIALIQSGDRIRRAARTDNARLRACIDSVLIAVSDSKSAKTLLLAPSIDSLRRAVTELDGIYERAVVYARAGDERSAGRYIRRWRDVYRTWLNPARDRITERSTRNATTLTLQSAVFRQRFIQNTWAVLVGVFTLVAIAVFLLNHGIRRSTKGLNEAMRAVAEGRLDHRVVVSGHDEFGDLAGGFNAMSARLAELDKLKADFLSNVSHELRTPIASVKQSAQLLLDEIVGPLEAEQKELIEVIGSNGQRLSALINDLLDTAKLEAGRVDIVPVPLDIREVIRSVVKSVTPLAKEKALRISMKADDDLPSIMGDQMRLEQVMVNLLSNAIKFTPEGNSITIHCHRNDDMVVCAVEDTGVGIPPEEVPRVFDKFHQVRATKTRKVKGTGLGLTIVKHLVESHRGTIHVESVVDTGTTFTFTLPLQT